MLGTLKQKTKQNRFVEATSGMLIPAAVKPSSQLKEKSSLVGDSQVSNQAPIQTPVELGPDL